MNAIRSNRNLRPPSPSFRLPSRRRIHSLTLRTSDSHSSHAMGQAPPSAVSSVYQDLAYPIPIPPEKLEKALKLYRTWKTAEGLARLDETTPADSYLQLPTTPTARSRTSGGSSKRHGTSVVSTSSYAPTEMTSVLSFDGNSTSAHELTAFNGTRVRTRTRRPFQPAGKARTALVRWLGSCAKCRERRVSCPLEEHHDIAHLERLHAASQSGNNVESSGQHRARSSGSSSSQRTARSISGRQGQDNTNTSRDDFIGIDQNPLLLQAPYSSVDAIQQDIQSPGGADPLVGISANATISTIQFSSLDEANPESNMRDQNSLLFYVGREWGAIYKCAHADCEVYYDNVEELQTHFEGKHFQYQRVEQPVRHYCFACLREGVNAWNPCTYCGEKLATWIVGQHFRVPTYYPDPADGPTPMPYDTSSAPFTPVVHPPQDEGSQWQQDLDGGDGNFDEESYRDEPSNYESYGDVETMDFEFNLFPDSSFDNDSGNGFRSARQMAFEHSVRYKYTIAMRHLQRKKLSFLLSFIMVLTLLLFAYHWVVGKQLGPLSSPDCSYDHLPKLGFTLMLGSFSLSLLFKRSSATTATAQLIPGSSLSTLLPYTNLYQPAPHTYIQCTGYL